MTIRVGINGFGRMGRLFLRAAWDNPAFDVVHINEVAGDAATAAHLLNYDSVHGKWQYQATLNTDSHDDAIQIGERLLSFSQHETIEDSPWYEIGVDLVVECTGKFKTPAALQPYLDHGVKKVVVSAPVKGQGVENQGLENQGSEKEILNIVVGVNDHLYSHEQHDIVTAASCTTNCLAPVVKVIHEQLGIVHGSITTIHDITNTQSILDQPHKDLRRARASSMSLIPTTTGSATAITAIFPELTGKLNGIAVRVPLANASLTDCVFEVARATSVDEVNGLLKAAADDELDGVLGYEELPLVSVDYTNDTRSSIVDALSTMVVNGTQVKILAWYDNEVGYVNRMAELTAIVAHGIKD